MISAKVRKFWYDNFGYHVEDWRYRNIVRIFNDKDISCDVKSSETITIVYKDNEGNLERATFETIGLDIEFEIIDF